MHRLYYWIAALGAAVLFLTSSGNKQARTSARVPQPERIILEADFDDIDDAIAVDILHKYIDMGKAEVLAVNINKGGLLPAEFADAVNTFYGRGDIPIGIIEGAAHNDDNDCYIRRTLDSANFKHSIADYGTLPAAWELSRKLLAGQADASVTFVSTGSTTNLAKLLDSPADSYSPLTGKELVARKVKMLAIVACDFREGGRLTDFNVAKDVPSAVKVFSEWPTDIVISPVELGDKVLYYGENIGDLEWYKRPFQQEFVNPVALGYRLFKQMPYNHPMWGPATTIFAVEGEGDIFSTGTRGTISIDGKGISTFRENPSGHHRILTVDGRHVQQAEKLIMDLVYRRPEKYFHYTINYDESRIPPYTNADPLTFANGKKVRSKADWRKRREEILEIFQSEMYGRMPEASPIYLDTLECGPTCHAYGTRTQVRMWFKPDHTGPFIDWLCVTPNKVKGKSPVIITLNYLGNHTVLPDEQIIICDSNYVINPRAKSKVKAGPEARGMFVGSSERNTFPIGVFLAKGYSFVTACYHDVSPDPTWTEGHDLQAEYAHSSGVFELWGPYDPDKSDGTTALNAWAWALMRGMDMIEKSEKLDERHVILTGYSRLGKAALIAGAFDERFPITVPVQTGGGGVPLFRRFFGEDIMIHMQYNHHWYCPAYNKWVRNEENMPFDQHMFLACVAPRALLVEGFTEPAFDPEGEFEALKAASPVWKFLGGKGLPRKAVFPEPFETDAIGDDLGYVYRDNSHGQADDDWIWILDFAGKVFGKQPVKE